MAQLRHLVRGSIVKPVQRSVRYLDKRLLLFGLLAVIGFPLYYFVWSYLFPQPYENLALRLAGGILFVPIVFARRWPQKARPYLPGYWYFAIFYALPFFFTYMLLKNNASEVWLTSALAAILVMILLLDWLNFIIQLVAGVSLAWVAYVLTSDTVAVPAAVYVQQLPVFLFTILFGSIANYTSGAVKQEQLRAMTATASTIAHELRTPLLGIRTGAAGLQRFLPNLLEAHRLAREAGLAVEPLRTAHRRSLDGVLERIQAEVNYSNTIIDMLLMKVRAPRADETCCSMQACVEEALSRYPFASEVERSLVSLHGGADFRFRGDPLLMVHVLFNLLKNALYHIARAGKGEILIRWAGEAGGGRLVFRDTGPGVPPEVLPHIFERFYSWSQNRHDGPGMGIGLAFCKGTMQSFGGSISCQSQAGEFTEFVLTFPVEARQ